MSKNNTCCTYDQAIDFFLEYSKRVLHAVEKTQIDQMCRKILTSSRIFVLGVGRSGLVGKAFAMRLMHLGEQVYVIGDTITPPIRRSDLIILISGSGETPSVVSAAKISRKEKAYLIAITGHPESKLAKYADLVVHMKARSKQEVAADYVERQLLGTHGSMAPMGTLFELCTMIFLDSVIAELGSRNKEGEEKLRTRHANIE